MGAKLKVTIEWIMYVKLEVTLGGIMGAKLKANIEGIIDVKLKVTTGGIMGAKLEGTIYRRDNGCQT